MDDDLTAKPGERFAIYRAADAKDYGEHNIQRVDDITPAIAEGLAHYMAGEGAAPGSIVQLLYGAPGFSLTKVWFKSGFPLPLHSHGNDCLYYIVAGSVRVGNEELGPGDGFFVGADVPYTYTTGPQGVEVLEFRNSNELNIRFKSRTKTYWEKAGAKIRERQDSWNNELPPSALTHATER